VYVASRDNGEVVALARAAAAVVLISVIAGCGSSGTSRPQVPAPVSAGSIAVSPAVTATHWLIAGSAIAKLDGAAGQAVVARYLDGPQTTVITGSSIPSSLDGWHTAFALNTRSLAEIQHGVGNGLPSRISEIVYDPEHWSFTPLTEQSDVGGATAHAASLAHSAGRQLIAAPATDLARPVSPGEPASTAFLRTDDLAKVAVSANVVEIQAQGLGREPARYAAYVKQAVSQIRSAHPGVAIYAGLSTNATGGPVTAAELLSDVRLTSSEVYGYWLNIPSPGIFCPGCGQPQPRIGLELLQQLAR